MKNFIQPGRIVPVVVSAAVRSGDLVIVGKFFGVAQSDAGVGERVEVLTEGVFTLPKITEQAWTQGAAIYWAVSDEVGSATTTASGNTLIGHATEAASNPSSHGAVRLSV